MTFGAEKVTFVAEEVLEEPNELKIVSEDDYLIKKEVFPLNEV